MSTRVILRIDTCLLSTAKDCVKDLVEKKLAATGFVYSVEAYESGEFQRHAIADLYTDQGLAKKAADYIEECYGSSIPRVVEIATHDLSEELSKQIIKLHDPT